MTASDLHRLFASTTDHGDEYDAVPYGFCHCGCGEKTRLATRSRPYMGHVAGEPLRYINGHNGRKTDPAYREEDRGFRTPCWIWQRDRSESGYGQMSVERQTKRAHRVYYERHVGPIPEGLQLDHLCRVRACVNPDHLEVVTPAENSRRARTTRLTPEAVAEIRASAEKGVDLARRFGVTKATISDVQGRRSWAEVA